MSRYVYVVIYPDDAGQIRVFGTASKAIAQLKDGAKVEPGAVAKLKSGQAVYTDDECSSTHAFRQRVQ